METKEVKCYITPEEAKFGCTKASPYQEQFPCDACGGTGKKGWFRCKHCRGRGTVVHTWHLEIAVPPETVESAPLSYVVKASEPLPGRPLSGNLVLRAVIRDADPNAVDLGDLFADFFGSGGSDNQEDVHQNLVITTEEAHVGGSRTLSYTVSDICPHCNGSGSSDTTLKEPTLCTKCDGKGRVVKDARTPFGRLQSSHTCKSCKGRGRIVKKPCVHCGGNGLVDTPAQQDVPFAAGTSNQDTTFPEKGHYISPGKRGALIVHVSVDAK